MSRSLWRLCLLSAASASLLGASAVAQPVPSGRGAGDVVINMREVELADVAQQISRITGRTLILDPNVKGTVNVVSAEPLTADGVWDLFQSVLRVHGFGAVRSGAAWRIVPQAAVVQGGGSTDLRGARSQDLVTSLIRLHNLSSDVAARAFKPLVASFGAIEALPRPNAIVITDYADNVRRIERLVLALDGGSGTTVEAIPLRYGSAKDLAQAIEHILGDDTTGGPKIAIDERSNIVIVKGDPEAIAQARRVALVLDVPGGAAPKTKVFRLSNSDAESIIEVLRGVMGGQTQATNAVAKSLSGPAAGSPAGLVAQTGADTGMSPLATTVLGSSNSSAATGQGSPGRIAAVAPAASAGFTANDVSIQSSPELNAIVVRGSASSIETVGSLISELDVRRPQVMIEAAIVEITGEAAEQLGVQLGSSAAAPVSGVVGATSFSNAGITLPSILTALGAPATLGNLSEGLTIAGGRRNEFSILVQALGTSSKANLLSTPSLTTLDNQPAEIVVGQNVPFRTGSFTTTGNSTDPFTTITRQDVGITLHVVPRVHEGDVIRLDVSQEVSSIAPTTVGAADIITNRRSIQTTVLADDGQTIVLGGLITDDRMSSKNQVPVLGSIPVLGNLFKSQTQSQDKRTLFVFLRPTILRDPVAAAAAAKAKYDRLRAEESRSGKGPGPLVSPPTPRLGPDLPSVF